MDAREKIRVIVDNEGVPPKAGPEIVDIHDFHDLARRFIEARYQYKDFQTLYRWREDWYRWNKAAYVEVTTEEMRSQLRYFLEQFFHTVVLPNGNKFEAPVKPNNRLLNEVVDALRGFCHIETEADVWLTGDGPADIIPCANGLLQISTEKLLPPNPAYFTFNALEFDYDENAPVPVKWHEFLGQVFPNDQEAIDCIQEVCGYMVSSDTDLQKLFAIIGPKRCGKGTLMRILQRLIGTGNYCNPTLTQMVGEFGLQQWINKRAAIFGDLRVSKRTDPAVAVGQMLQITGEDSMSINRKNKDFWNGQLKTRILLASNDVPEIDDMSGVLSSRVIMVRLKVSFFGREDLGLMKKLLPELPGILKWAIAGLKILRARGHFVQPKSADEALQQMEDLASPMTAFLRAYAKVDAQGLYPTEKLYRNWCQFCADHSKDHGNPIKFGKDLAMALPQLTKSKPWIGQGAQKTRQPCYVGIRELTAAEEEEIDDPEEAKQANMDYDTRCQAYENFN